MALGIWVGLSGGMAAAQPKPDPDYPCVRVLVPTLSPGLIWSGPPIDAIPPDAWRQDAKVAELVPQITDRRMPPDKATAAIDGFAAGLDEGTRSERLVLLFSGAFHILQEQRTESLDAIRRYSVGQREILDRIAGHLKRLETEKEGTPGWREASDALTADRRILDDRRRMLTAVCDRPVLFEQRLGILSRAIARHLPAE